MVRNMSMRWYLHRLIGSGASEISRLFWLVLLVMGCRTLTAVPVVTCTPVMPPKEKAIQPFALRNVDGKIWNLDSQNSAKGFIVIFTCNHCPFASLYPGRFNALQAEFAPKGVAVIAINSMDSNLYEEESFEKMQAKAKTDGFTFPYLQDASQAVGKQFGAEHTPQCFVVWKENGKWLVKYSGAIDDNGEDASSAHSFVAAAVGDLLSNKPVAQPFTESFGCRIIYRMKF